VMMDVLPVVTPAVGLTAVPTMMIVGPCVTVTVPVPVLWIVVAVARVGCRERVRTGGERSGGT